jgi:hypothetical protein
MWLTKLEKGDKLNRNSIIFRGNFVRIKVSIAKTIDEIAPDIDVIIFLGKNWDRESIKRRVPRLSIASKITCMAAVALHDKSSNFILSTGYTSGYCESDYMLSDIKFYCDMFGNHPGFSTIDFRIDKFILEKRSIDTAENMEFCKEIIELNNFQRVAICTVGFHLERSLELASAYGLPVIQGIDSVALVLDVLKNKNSSLTRGIEDYKNSFDYCFREQILEYIARVINQLEPKGTLIRRLTIYLRNRKP